MKLVRTFIYLALISPSNPLFASQEYQSDYIGQESRLIKSLSRDDIQQLENGKGWGLAKAAELNGIPGPVHILQMKDQIHLSVAQTKQVQQLFAEMKQQAIPLGRKLIQLEKELNQAFAKHSINIVQLREHLDEISAVRAQLRYVHLAAHLKTPGILTARQIAQYNQLRGYHKTDPCASVPQGHDAEMWKKHNGCS